MHDTIAYMGRLEDERLSTGRGRYVADLRMPRLAHGVVVRSVYAHAKINGIDITAAKAAPGVLAVLTAADLTADGIGDLPCGVELPKSDGQKAFQAKRPVLARDRVRYVGECVAFVIAETAEQAEAAGELVEIDYDPLDAVADVGPALASGAPAVWDEVPDNIAYLWKKGDKDAFDKARASAHKVVSLKSHVTRVTACSMEPRGALGLIDDEGRLVIHSSTQTPFNIRPTIASLFKLDQSKVRILAGDVGGSFGMKSGAYPEDVLVVWAAKRLGRPVRWISERRESFLSDDHGRDVYVDAELALDANGRFLALRTNFDVNIGCYLSGRSLFMIGNIGGVAGVYRIPTIVAGVRGVFTNIQTSAPYRGAGRPEATYTIERLIDMAARELGIDPYDLRMRNLVAASAMPYDTGLTFTYDCGEFEGNMTGAAEIADRAGFEKRRAESAKRGKLRGLGISNPIEVAGGPYAKPGKDYSSIRVSSDGTVTLNAGVMSVGQGLETMLSQLVAKRLSVPIDKVRYVQGDTDLLPGGRGNGGSSSTGVGGACVSITLDNTIAKGREIAADMLEVKPEEVEFEDGHFRLPGTNRSLTLFEIADHAEKADDKGFTASGEFQPPAVTFPNGCHMCEVEIDPETGALEILRYTVVEDIGTVINPTLARGQIHGGIAQGVAQAIGEKIVYDSETAQLATGSFMDYMIPRAHDLPNITIQTREVPTKVNVLGAKGVGEAGTVGSLVATINAVCDALAPLGVTHVEMPASPARIWEAIQAARKDKAA
jgi:carbon-monoxide dehydrogenase large subunit